MFIGNSKMGLKAGPYLKSLTLQQSSISAKQQFRHPVKGKKYHNTWQDTPGTSLILKKPKIDIEYKKLNSPLLKMTT